MAIALTTKGTSSDGHITLSLGMTTALTKNGILSSGHVTLSLIGNGYSTDIKENIIEYHITLSHTRNGDSIDNESNIIQWSRQAQSDWEWL